MLNNLIHQQSKRPVSENVIIPTRVVETYLSLEEHPRRRQKKADNKNLDLSVLISSLF